jgi:hypothetical protein
MKMEKQEEIRNYLQNELAVTIQPGSAWKEMEKILSEYIEDLIQRDFDKLVSLLYRIDVSESRLRKVLAENTGVHTSELVSQMIIERQLQKIESREKFKAGGAENDEEKW